MKYLIFIIPLLLGSRCSERYAAPSVEKCIILNYVQNNTDTASCFCIDKRINRKNYVEFKNKVIERMSDHYLSEQVISYIDKNKSKIIKTHEYELPVQYCRGFFATNIEDYNQLESWAESNRIERIKCEMH